MSYRIHRNGNNKSWTVLSKTPDGWRKSGQHNVIHAPRIDFLISEAGHQRVLREGTRNVHAWAVVEEFEPIDRTGPMDVWGGQHQISYTPFDDRGFTCEALSNIAVAKQCTFAADGFIYARTVGARH